MGKSVNDEQPWLNIEQACEYLNVSKDIIYEGVNAKGLKHVRVMGRRDLRFKRSWLDAWFEEFATVNKAA